MSKIDGQITGLRKAAQVYHNLGKYAIEVVLLDAADTICELRGALQVASVDYGQLAAENAKLRQQLEDVTVSMGRVEERCTKLRELVKRMHRHIRQTCGECDGWYCSNFDEDNECCVYDTLAREVGVEVKL